MSRGITIQFLYLRSSKSTQLKLSYETRIGILTVIALVILVFGFRFLKGRNVLEKSNMFYVLYDNVDQLAEAAPVYIRGFQVGTVVKIVLAPEDPTKILVTLDVKKEIPLPVNTKAEIFNASFMSGRAVRLVFDEYCSGENCASSRSYLQGTVVGMLGSMVSEDEISSYMRTIGTQVDSLLGTDMSDSSAMVGNIQGSIQHLTNITRDLDLLLSESQRSLSKTFENLSSITGNIRSNNTRISEAIDNLAEISRQLKEAGLTEFIQNTDQAMQNAGKTLRSFDELAIEMKSTAAELDELLKAMNQDDGTLKQIMTDPELYRNIESASRNLDLLLQDFRLHPRRYLQISVFGKNPDQPYAYPGGDPAEQGKQ